MSSFSVPVVRLEKIGAHPNADRLDITQVGGYQAIVQKGRFKEGDIAVYIPEQAIVPERILKASGFWDEGKDKGMLAGSNGDRVKAVKLRGIFSQGILIDADTVQSLLGSDAGNYPILPGTDYADRLGITKWQPPIPAHLSGDVEPVTVTGWSSYTDIENIKKYPNVLWPEEIVYMTEKLHGTCLVFHYDAETDRLYVSSKGLAGKGLALKYSETNFYWRVAQNYEIEDKLRHVLSWLNFNEEGDTEYLGVTLFGEGLAVQDLKYGFAGSDAAARFFDLRFITREPVDEIEALDRAAFHVKSEYTNFSSTHYFLQQMDLPSVPVLYLGPFDPEALEMHTSGKTALGAGHIREGVVVQPQIPRVDPEIGRVILKSISEDYLLRRGSATEYE